MAEKKVVLILAPAADISGGSKALDSLLKKGALFPRYAPGEVLDGSVAETEWLRLEPAAVGEALEKGAALVVTDLGAADRNALEAALAVILEAADRRTTVAVVGRNAAVFHGAGVNAKAGTADRPVAARDILPTLAAVGEFPLTGEGSGVVVYQALKTPNPKLEEIRRLREAIRRMEGALARDSREPWDKHDCA
jgi:hypothetical protein